MGYGQYSNDNHKPFNKRELLEHAARNERLPIDGKAARLVAKNTLHYVMFNPAGIANESYLYHKTRILVLTYDNQEKRRPLLQVMINTGGYNTLTTRERLNRFLPSGWNVFTDKGFLFVTTPAGTFPHADGALYHGNGNPFVPGLHKDSRALAVALKRKIDKFCRAIDREGFPAPNAGDPWIFDWNPRAIGTDIITDWLDSEYVNGALIVAAMKRKGFPDAGIGLYFHDMQNDKRKASAAPVIKRAVRDFFKAGLGLG